MACKGKCINEKPIGGYNYNQFDSKCTECQRSLNSNGLARCYCCNNPLRHRRRSVANRIYKQKKRREEEREQDQLLAQYTLEKMIRKHTQNIINIRKQQQSTNKIN